MAIRYFPRSSGSFRKPPEFHPVNKPLPDERSRLCGREWAAQERLFAGGFKREAIAKVSEQLKGLRRDALIVEDILMAMDHHVHWLFRGPGTDAHGAATPRRAIYGIAGGRFRSRLIALAEAEKELVRFVSEFQQDD